MALTLEQKRAIAIASARKRAAEKQPETASPEIPESNIPVFNWARESGLLKGMLDPAAGGAQLIEKIRGTTSIADPASGIDEQVKREEKAYQERREGEGEEGVDWARMGGNILSPASLATLGVGMPATTGARVLQGAKLGAGYGAAQPVTGEGDFAEQKAMQIGLGGAVGGAIPLGVAGARKGIEYLDELSKPIYQSGIERDVGKFVTEQAGPQRAKIVEALQKGKKGQTAGQAIAEANRASPDDFGGQFVRLEKELAKEPLEGAALRGKYGQQAAGREKIIDAIAGTEDDMSKAISTRTAETKPLYDAVRESSKNVDPTPVRGAIDRIIQNNVNEPDVVNPLTEILGKLDDTSPRAMQSLSKRIKKMMASTTPGGQKEFNVEALSEVKQLLDKQIGTAEKSYEAAQTAYKELSTPINQMKIGRELKEALINATEKETPATFTGAVRKAPRTLKRATGFPRYNELGDVLTPEQVDSVGKVTGELVNLSKFNKMASEVGPILKDVKGEVISPLPRVLSRPVVIANHLIGLLAKDRTPEYKAILIKIMQDPKELEKVLALPADNPRRKVAMDAISRLSAMSASQTTAREAGE